jgi:hypothetical protein
MNLPSPQWMAEKAYQVICDLTKNLDIERTILGSALKLHKSALELRCNNAALFPFILPITNLMKVVEMGLDCVTFYNMNSHEPLSTYEDKFDVIQIHSILMQALLSKEIVCPLKAGQPFRCRNSNSPSDTLCLFVTPDGRRSECMADLLDSRIS